MGMIDRQYKNTLQLCIKHKEELFYELLEAKDKIKMLEKLLELNMKDFWEMVDQRDWYHNLYTLNKKR